jgi:isoquinoline 1-oxidoreductase beta subunit
MIQNVSRRDFLGSAAAASVGLALAVRIPFLEGSTTEASHELGAFIHVGNDGVVRVSVPKPDIGQGVLTSLSMLIAEELDVDWNHVRAGQAGFAAKYGSMGVGSSSSIRSLWLPMRRAGATARAMLVSAAAARWNVDPSRCTTSSGVIHCAGKRLGYGQVAEEASMLPVPKDVSLKPASAFKIIGKGRGRIDEPLIVSGRAIYGADVRPPGMLYAVVRRAPVFGATVASVDDSKARLVPGLRSVVEIKPMGTDLPWSGVAAVADSTFAAMRARDALRVTWNDGPGAAESTESLREAMLIAASSAGKVVRNDGNALELLDAGAAVDVTYEVPYLAHATMEPMNATVDARAGRVEIWAPTQGADWVASTVARRFGLRPDQIIVHATLSGGGFGRRGFSDFVLEAAILSRAVGNPVRVQWTREDDLQHDFYRPPSVHRVKAGLREGRIAAWHHRLASPSISAYLGDGEAFESETGGIHDLPYAIENMRVEYALADSHVPRGWWRSVEHSVNTFVVQSVMDELAHAAGADPIAFRLAHLPPQTPAPAETAHPFAFSAGRMRRVMELVRDRARWNAPRPPGRALGFAACFAYCSYIAQIAEVSRAADGGIRVHRVLTAVDCGTPVNPDGIAAQIEGGVVFALTAALLGRITIAKGRVEQSNFHDYPVLRIDEIPEVEVNIVPSEQPPSGIGEVGGPCVAPAVANAFFALTGQRIRRLPLSVLPSPLDPHERSQ